MRNLVRRIIRSARYRSRRLLPQIHLFSRLLKMRYALPPTSLEAITGGRDVNLADPILEDLCLPPFLGPADHNDFVPLMKIAACLQPRKVLELGTAHGNLAANICRQCPAATVYTVNATPDQLTGEMVTFCLAPEEIGRVYRAYGYGGRVVQIYANTLHFDPSQYFGGPTVDLVVIDGCHDTEYVVNDFLKTAPFVRRGGIVLLHDTHPSMEGHLAGSYVACMILRRRGFDIRQLRNTWWAVWVAHQDSRWPAGHDLAPALVEPAAFD